MRITTLVAAAAAAILSAGSLQAQYFSAFSPPGQTGSPFWDRTSSDNGQGCNIGYVLTGQTSSTACNSYHMLGGDPWTVASTIQAQPTWFGHANGNVNQSVGFGFISGSTGATVTYWGGIAGANPLAALSLRDGSGNPLYTFDVTHLTFHVDPYTFFDVGIARYSPAGNSYSWSADVPNQFSVFGNGAYGYAGAWCGTSCWVGAEDIRGNLNSTDYDYQDGVLQIVGANTTVPEPSSIVLMASGLIGIAVTARRRRKNNA